jgi:hypothetical protein
LGETDSEYEWVWVTSDGLGELGGWFKRVKKALKLAVKKPLKILEVATLSPTLFMKRKETRGRVLRRAGGVVTGAVVGFATGGPAGAVAGSIVGGLKAKRGVKGIKGYGKIGLVSAATGFTAGAVAGAAGYGAYGGLGAKAYAFGAAKVGTLTLGKAVTAATMKRSSAPVAETTSGGAPTGEGLYSDNWQQPPVPGETTQSYMDLLRQTASIVPTQPQNVETGGTWGGGEGQYMPDPTGANIPGQESEQELVEAEVPVFAGLTSKQLLMIGGAGLVLTMLVYKK